MIPHLSHIYGYHCIHFALLHCYYYSTGILIRGRYTACVKYLNIGKSEPLGKDLGYLKAQLLAVALRDPYLSGRI